MVIEVGVIVGVMDALLYKDVINVPDETINIDPETGVGRVRFRFWKPLRGNKLAVVSENKSPGL
jgi:hypothetical protein